MKERTRQRLLREQRAGACANHCSFPCTAKKPAKNRTGFSVGYGHGFPVCADYKPANER